MHKCHTHRTVAERYCTGNIPPEDRDLHPVPLRFAPIPDYDDGRWPSQLLPIPPILLAAPGHPKCPKCKRPFAYHNGTCLLAYCKPIASLLYACPRGHVFHRCHTHNTLVRGYRPRPDYANPIAHRLRDCTCPNPPTANGQPVPTIPSRLTVTDLHNDPQLREDWEILVTRKKPRKRRK